MLRKAGQTAGLIELNFLWTLMGGPVFFFLSHFFQIFFLFIFPLATPEPSASS